MEITLTDKITVRLINTMGGDHMVVAAAKVSTSGEEALKFADPALADENAGLINFLMKNRHGTPFEHSALSFFVHAPIFVWREWHRHRIGFCLAGDSLVDFVDTNGMRNPGICRTVQQLYDRWEHGEVNGRATDSERLAEAMALVGRGVSIRTASAKTGVARGTIDRHRDGTRMAGKRGSRWRVTGMNLRVLDEDTQFFTSGNITDVIRSGVKELVSVCADARHSLRCSKDHRILTADGWAPTGELRRGDRIAVTGRRSRFSERQIPPSLRAGIGVWTSMQRARLIKPTDRCDVCGEQFPREALTLDHVMPVVTDLTKALDVNNLRPVCEPCHRIKTDSEQILAKRGNVSGSKYVRLPSTPAVCGEEMTYDISVDDPWHNFVANGIVVHNSYNEESARYKQLDPVFWHPRPDRKIVPAPDHKSARPSFQAGTEEQHDWLKEDLRAGYADAYARYQDRIDRGYAKEVARAGLPVGIYSSCWVTCNPRSLMAFLSLRTHEPDATFVSRPQAEIEQAARVAETFLAEGWPLTHAAFCRNGRVGP